MAKMIAFCGLDCSGCPAYLARKNDDQVLREKTAPEWSKMYNAEIKPSDINCVGCTVLGGAHISHCGECEFRKCGHSRKVANCARCADYPCDKLAGFLSMVPDAKKNLDEVKAALGK